MQVRTRTEDVEGVGIEQDIPLDLYLQELRRQGDLDALITFIERLPEDEAQAAIKQSLRHNPKLTIARLPEFLPISNFKNLDAYLDGLRRAGLPD